MVTFKLLTCKAQADLMLDNRQSQAGFKQIETDSGSLQNYRTAR